MTSTFSTPVVLILAGNDPSGGAGVAADIESLVSVGCHPAPVITALTVQDTQNVKEMVPLSPGLLAAQARAVLEDMPIAAIKIGLIGSVENIEVIHTLLMDYPHIPVILDPILAAGGGAQLATLDILDALRTLLLPLTTVLTPNSPEARRLAPAADSLEACASALLETNCKFVLITGTHEDSPKVNNILYGNYRLLETFTWERLPYSYHGSGCTLAATIAGFIAHGEEPRSAIRRAQNYTFEALRAGYQPGKGQHIPRRLFWATKNNPTL